MHQPQHDSYADFPPPPPSLLGDIFMTALSSSSASPPPVSPSPHGSPPPASTTTRKKNQPYRKKETVDEAILVYTALRQRVSLGESLTKALREAGISYPTFQRIHRPLGEASVLIPSSFANIGLVKAFNVLKGGVCGTAEGARMSAEGGDRCRINYLNFIYFLHIHNIYNVFNIYFHICI